MTKRLAAVATLSLAVVVAVVAVGMRRSPDMPVRSLPPQSPPNVVLIIACTLRADQTSVYTPELATTPAIARLGAQGVVFTDAIVAAPWTRPASVAILTGRHPGNVSMLDAGAQRDRRIPDGVVLAAERFHAEGYATVGRTANPNLDEAYGFAAGFDDYANLSPFWRGAGVVKVPGDELVASVLEGVDRVPAGRPVYVQAVFVDAHQPYSLGNSEASAWVDPDVPARVASYRAMVHALDGAVASLVAGLEARGVDASNTVFALVNDHGEGLRWPVGVGHGNGHGRYLYPTTTRMVWVLWGNGVAGGRRIGGLASQVDLLPTVLDVAGVDGPDMDGRSWAAAAEGQSPRTDRERAYTATMFDDVERAAVFTDERVCQWDFNPSGGRYDGEFRLPRFDSGCFHRQVDDHGAPIDDAELAVELQLWWRRMVRRNDSEQVTPATVPASVRRALEALGYVEEQESQR